MSQKRSKRWKKAVEFIDAQKSYAWAEAIELLKTLPSSKINETVDLAFQLGVDPRKSDQMVRGTVRLPHGSGKDVRVLVFASGEAAELAKKAGAEYVGFEDLIEKIKGGFQDFDVAIATPSAMQEVRKLGKILGPRGLMPNPKIGTVTEDTAHAVQECKAGRVEFKVDKAGNVHVVCGKVSFEKEKLNENGQAVIQAILRAKPSSSKGRYLKSCTVSSTFSPGILIDISPFLSA